MWNLSLYIDILNLALNCGSSKHGKAIRAYVGSNRVVAKYLKIEGKIEKTSLIKAMIKYPCVIKGIIIILKLPVVSFRSGVTAKIEPFKFSRV